MLSGVSKLGFRVFAPMLQLKACLEVAEEVSPLGAFDFALTRILYKWQRL